MNPDCLIPLLEHGDLLTWAGAAAAAGAAWLGLFAGLKYLLGKRETPQLALRGELVCSVPNLREHDTVLQQPATRALDRRT